MHVSRAKLLGTGTAMALIGPALLGPFITAAEAASEGDITILQGAATAERTAIKAYGDAAATGLLSPPVLAVAKGFMSDHMAHRDALEGAIKAAGVTPQTGVTAITYPSLKTEADILKFRGVPRARRRLGVPRRRRGAPGSRAGEGCRVDPRRGNDARRDPELHAHQVDRTLQGLHLVARGR